MLPNALHVGSAKAASTWLYQACLEHPKVYAPPHNDNLNFFVVHYHEGLDWYQQRYFAEWRGEKAAIDFSNSYLISELALQRIARDLPEARLSCILRNPVERAYLHWAHAYYKSDRRYGGEPATDSGNPLDAAPERPEGRLFQLPLEVVQHPNGWVWCRMMLEPGLYGFHLRQMRHCFPAERIHVMLYDDLCVDPQGVLARYFEFLGVDAAFRPGCLHRDINPDAPESDPASLPGELRAFLDSFYREDIEELEALIGRDLSAWR